MIRVGVQDDIVGAEVRETVEISEYLCQCALSRPTLALAQCGVNEIQPQARGERRLWAIHLLSGRT